MKKTENSAASNGKLVSNSYVLILSYFCYELIALSILFNHPA